MSPARFWLGMAQMAAATIAFVFLVMTGVSLLTISAALVSTTLTILSRGLHGSSTKSQSHSLLTGLGMAAAGVMERVRVEPEAPRKQDLRPRRLLARGASRRRRPCPRRVDGPDLLEPWIGVI